MLTLDICIVIVYMMETCSYLIDGGSGHGGGGVGCLDVLVPSPSPSLGLDLALLVQP